jgi:hypothetical protein
MGHFQGEMPHGVRNPFFINHQMELTTGSHLVPVAREVKGWPGDGLQAQKFSVEPFASFKVTDHDGDVVILFYLNQDTLLSQSR